MSNPENAFSFALFYINNNLHFGSIVLEKTQLLICCVRWSCTFRDVLLIIASISFFKLPLDVVLVPHPVLFQYPFFVPVLLVCFTFLLAISPQTILSLPLPELLLGVTQCCHCCPPKAVFSFCFLAWASCESAK